MNSSGKMDNLEACGAAFQALAEAAGKVKSCANCQFCPPCNDGYAHFATTVCHAVTTLRELSRESETKVRLMMTTIAELEIKEKELEERERLVAAKEALPRPL